MPRQITSYQCNRLKAFIDPIIELEPGQRLIFEVNSRVYHNLRKQIYNWRYSYQRNQVPALKFRFEQRSQASGDAKYFFHAWRTAAPPLAVDTNSDSYLSVTRAHALIEQVGKPSIEPIQLGSCWETFKRKEK